MTKHTCEGCPKSGDCNIEPVLKKLRVEFEDRGLPALLDAMIDSMKSSEEFGIVIKSILDIIGENVTAMYQFRVLAYQNAHRFPPGAREYGLHYVFKAVHKVLADEIMISAIAMTEELAKALGVENSMMAMRLSDKKFGELMGTAKTGIPEGTTETKPQTLH